MEKLKINSIEGKGNLQEECVWLDVLENIDSLAYYMVTDTTYTGDNSISNELRHMYWFAPKSVKKGDWIKLMTKAGTNSTANNNRKSTTHVLYWGLGRTIWNKAGDAAILFTIETWKTTKV